MAHHKSAKKRIKQNVKRQELNKAKKSRVRSLIKSLRLAIAEQKKDEAKTLFTSAQSLMAKLARGSAVNKKTAARVTARLNQQVSRL